VIVRVFRAEVHEGMQAAFERFFLEQAVPMLRGQPGMLGLTVGTPVESSPREFLMITRWASVEALREFAGEDWREAVIDPAEAHLLAATHVHHYENIPT
jgi:heme-degrading monooxygenase HmoA